MKITRISVTELFGIPSFTYDIELRAEPPITIIHGPNGSGKTVVFRMVYGLFHFKHLVFWKYPFSEFQVTLDNKETVTVIKTQTSDKRPRTKIVVRYSKQGNREYVLPDPELNRAMLHSLPTSIRNQLRAGELDVEEYISFVEQFGRVEDLFELSYDDEIVHVADRMRDRSEVPEWLEEISRQLNVRFIATNRLIVPRPISRDRFGTPREVTNAYAIKAYSDNLAEKIRAVILNADTTAKTLDRSFPSRVVSTVMANEQKIRDQINIQHELSELEKERNYLIDAGLLEPSEHDDRLEIVDEPEDSTLRNVLRTYIEDSQQKFAVYTELAKRIALFKEILEGMLTRKVVQVSKKGFEIQNEDEEGTIHLRDLSSGEQHIIVLIYELLFETTPNKDELILIDEPEISLHISWQKRFIQDLEQISKLSQFDVIIATHSPSIINGRLELLVAMQGATGTDE